MAIPMSGVDRGKIHRPGGGYTDRADRTDLKIRQSSTGELLENVDVTHSVLPGDLVIIGTGFF